MPALPQPIVINLRIGRKRRVQTSSVCATAIAGFACLLPCSAQTARYISLSSAQPALSQMRDSLPAELKSASPLDAALWDRWVQKKDHEIRDRVDRGEEITLTNLLRLGVTFTRQSRIDYQSLDRYQRNPQVTAIAEKRADDLVQALGAVHLDDGMLEMREFLDKQGFNVKTVPGRRKAREYLLDCLARQRDEASHSRQLARVDPSQAFKDRGLSTDSDLYPDFMIHRQLEAMLAKGLLKPGGIHRVAIIGPGLDFVNKKYGADFYPPQTTQPFAFIDSLIRLHLADAASLELRTFDISPRVNRHLERARARATEGRPYTIQLLCAFSDGWNPDFLAGMKKYWQNLGERVGRPAPPLAVPASIQETIQNRAISVRPDVVSRIRASDMNVVFQTVPLPPDQRFDLVIGTNIFLYYDAFEQALARINLSEMIKPGGFLLSNTALAGPHASKLEDSLHTEITITQVPLVTDGIYGYLRK